MTVILTAGVSAPKSSTTARMGPLFPTKRALKSAAAGKVPETLPAGVSVRPHLAQVTYLDVWGKQVLLDPERNESPV